MTHPRYAESTEKPTCEEKRERVARGFRYNGKPKQKTLTRKRVSYRISAELPKVGFTQATTTQGLIWRDGDVFGWSASGIAFVGGEDGANAGAGGTRVHFQASAQLGEALAHAGQADAAGVAAAEALEDIGVEAPAVVGDDEDDEVVGTEDLDVHRAGLGMAVHVGERFLENAKQSQLDLPGKTLHNLRQMQLDLNATALGKALGIPASSGVKTQFIEQRRMEQVGNGSDFADGAIGQLYDSSNKG